MSQHAAWYLARATGYVAWALVSTSVVTGLMFSSRLTRRRPRPAWTLDLHRYLGGTAAVFTALHIGGLVADNYVHFGFAEVLVPFASSWKPSAVAFGVVAAYLLVAIEVTSLAMRRLPRRAWHAVHLTSFVLFWCTSFHLLLAGTDATNPVSRTAAVGLMVLVVVLTFVRLAADRATRTRPSPIARPDTRPVTVTPTTARRVRPLVAAPRAS